MNFRPSSIPSPKPFVVESEKSTEREPSGVVKAIVAIRSQAERLTDKLIRRSPHIHDTAPLCITDLEVLDDDSEYQDIDTGVLDFVENELKKYETLAHNNQPGPKSDSEEEMIFTDEELRKSEVPDEAPKRLSLDLQAVKKYLLDGEWGIFLRPEALQLTLSDLEELVMHYFRKHKAKEFAQNFNRLKIYPSEFRKHVANLYVVMGSVHILIPHMKDLNFSEEETMEVINMILSKSVDQIFIIPNWLDQLNVPEYAHETIAKECVRKGAGSHVDRNIEKFTGLTPIQKKQIMDRA